MFKKKAWRTTTNKEQIVLLSQVFDGVNTFEQVPKNI